MDDLTSFILARLDEDEAAAREAIADPGMAAEWHETTSGCLDVGLPDHGGEDWRDYVWPQGDSRVTRFIARHDPARVLREAEAKRAIIKWHPSKPMRNIDANRCPQCELTWPCLTVTSLAAVYSDHPDWRPEWKP